MKNIVRALVLVLAGAALALFVGCGLQLPSVEDVTGIVSYPEQYSITYEVKSKDGVITTVQKIVDGEGNVYFKAGESEQLYLKDGAQYVLYQKDQNGKFVTLPGSSYADSYVEQQTKQFSEYAEASRNQMMPTAKKSGTAQVLERECDVYTITVGSEKTGVRYSYYVDRETGICLGYESGMSAAGFDLGADSDVFYCVEFVVENVASLRDLTK